MAIWVDGRRKILESFLVCALEARVAEANGASSGEGRCSLNNYIETELVNLVTLRDIAELEIRMPGFADAVHQWIMDDAGVGIDPSPDVMQPTILRFSRPHTGAP